VPEYGVTVGPLALTLHPADLARLLEDYGFESVFVPDHAVAVPEVGCGGHPVNGMARYAPAAVAQIGTPAAFAALTIARCAALPA
jgi:alkanesulfonate monooxygenase SsuD/methylene tetrahydromethanopterin reductase-like flavin-dependent oxidoreductase (luciferase family)